MKMVTAQVMAHIDKPKAVAFVLKMREIWLGHNLPPSQFKPMVRASLLSIGIEADFTDGTANAICTKMERKAKMEIL